VGDTLIFTGEAGENVMRLGSSAHCDIAQVASGPYTYGTVTGSLILKQEHLGLLYFASTVVDGDGAHCTTLGFHDQVFVTTTDAHGRGGLYGFPWTGIEPCGCIDMVCHGPTASLTYPGDGTRSVDGHNWCFVEETCGVSTRNGGSGADTDNMRYTGVNGCAGVKIAFIDGYSPADATLYIAIPKSDYPRIKAELHGIAPYEACSRDCGVEEGACTPEPKVPWITQFNSWTSWQKTCTCIDKTCDGLMFPGDGSLVASDGRKYCYVDPDTCGAATTMNCYVAINIVPGGVDWCKPPTVGQTYTIHVPKCNGDKIAYIDGSGGYFGIPHTGSSSACGPED